jgi:hypothetical protein
MIRRDDGGDWLVIEQIKHATLAGEIARAWGNEGFEPLARAVAPSATRRWPLQDEERAWNRARGACAQAVYHHDDGWSEWDWAPRLDPQSGKPRDFREMRMRDATAIWTKSIDSQAKLFPLAAYGISRHFCYLAEQVQSSGRHDADDLAAVRQFIEQQSSVRSRLEQQAAIYGQIDESRRYRESCYRCVQFFDHVSLWLCCADEREPGLLTAPMGEIVTFSSQPASPSTETIGAEVYRLQVARPDYRAWRVAIEPYPLAEDMHQFSIEARRIPARRYADDADLQATWRSAPTVQLVWMLSKA